MEFRLTYQGPLYAEQTERKQGQRDNRASHKHDIRKAFHHQLKRLWDVTPFLEESGPRIRISPEKHAESHDINTLSNKHQLLGFQFVPLITRDIQLLCGLDVLFLRPDTPGKLWAGDIDNRIKTLIDALRIPKLNELNSDPNNIISPGSDEMPFFCLLEEDQLITKLSVETDQLLEFVTPGNLSDVRLVITVRVRPYAMHPGNMEFGG